MKKAFVDEILKKKSENLPGPERYNAKPAFGVNANTTSYSMRKNLGAFDRHLSRESRLPGPSSYYSNDLCGKGINSSTMRSSVSNAFPKSTDRFRPSKQQSPAVTKYSVRDGMNENFSSVRNYAGHTKFGTNKKTFIDQNWHLDRAKN